VEFSAYDGGNSVLYGDPSLDDPLTGPVLVATRAWGDEDAYVSCPADEQVETGVRSRNGPVIACGKDWYWVTWSGPNNDLQVNPHQAWGIIGRGVSPRRLAQIADWVTIPKDLTDGPHTFLEIPREALPSGLEPLARAPVIAGWAGIPASDYFAWTGRRDHYASLTVTDADADLALLTQVLEGAEPAEVRGHPGAVTPRRDDGVQKVIWQEAGLLLVFSHDLTDPDADAFLASLADASMREVDRLKNSILQTPPEELLAPGEKLAASGRAGKLRWAVGVDGRRETVYIHHVDHGEIGGSGGTVGRVKRNQILTNRRDFGGSQLVIAQVHADVAKVVATTQDGQEIDLPLGKSVLPDGSRYCGVWLDKPAKLNYLTAYDADGNRIARASPEL